MEQSRSRFSCAASLGAVLRSGVSQDARSSSATALPVSPIYDLELCLPAKSPDPLANVDAAHSRITPPPAEPLPCWSIQFLKDHAFESTPRRIRTVMAQENCPLFTMNATAT